MLFTAWVTSAPYMQHVCVCLKDTNTDMHKDLKLSNFYERIIYKIAASIWTGQCNNLVNGHFRQAGSQEQHKGAQQKAPSLHRHPQHVLFSVGVSIYIRLLFFSLLFLKTNKKYLKTNFLKATWETKQCKGREAVAGRPLEEWRRTVHYKKGFVEEPPAGYWAAGAPARKGLLVTPGAIMFCPNGVTLPGPNALKPPLGCCGYACGWVKGCPGKGCWKFPL